MIVKIIIIAAVIIIGAAFLVPQSSDILSDPFSITDSIDLDIEGIQSGAVQQVEGAIDGTVSAVDGTVSTVGQSFGSLKDKSKYHLNVP